jgi:hypothetical protein
MTPIHVLQSLRPPTGGTELMLAGLIKHLPEELRAKVHISVSTVAGAARHLKPHIFWAHQSFDQPSVQNLHDPLVQASIDVFVFVSEWQQATYQKHFGIAFDKCRVIRNAIELPSTLNPQGH